MELTELCKKCLGCNKLENPNFKGVNECEYHTVEQIGLEQCKKIIEQIKMEKARANKEINEEV